MSLIADVIVIGSGPSGAQAAKQALEDGYSVALLDFGNDDPDLRGSVPDRSFSEIRRAAADQRKYFLGELDAANIRDVRVGAHLSPPRSFITRDVEKFLPFRSSSFHPLQSLSIGGLGAGWGAGVFTFEPFELELAGLPAGQMRPFYDAVSKDIGISAAYEDDTAPYCADVAHAQPPLALDSNALSIMQAYERKKDQLHDRGFVFGRAPLAVLTQAKRQNGMDRHPNPYFDMDFYGDSRRSVYRPRYSIEEMLPNPKFKYIPRVLVETVRETDAGSVAVRFLSSDQQHSATLYAPKVLIAAGALNTARIVLRSLGAYGQRTPLLSNPYHYLPSINLRMLGRPADDKRHSLCQIVSVLDASHRGGERVTTALYSYRSLLLYKLVKEMPLPPALGLICARTLASSLTIAGVHHPDAQSTRKWLELRRTRGGDSLSAEYSITPDEQAKIHLDLSEVKSALIKVGVVPFACLNPGWGSSIHYAGTVPSGENATVARTDLDGRLIGTENIYLADSSSWNYLPAKGLTFTLMANARRVAKAACRTLRPEALR